MVRITSPAKTAATNGISEHKGPVTLGTPCFNINSTCCSVSGTTKSSVSNSVAYVGSTTDNYSLGAALSDANIQNIVSDAMTSNRLSKDTNGVYFVLTSGFLTQYCGWHTHGTIGAQPSSSPSLVTRPATTAPVPHKPCRRTATGLRTRWRA